MRFVFENRLGIKKSVISLFTCFVFENRLGIKKSVISLFTWFVRIPARNSVNPIIQIT